MNMTINIYLTVQTRVVGVLQTFKFPVTSKALDGLHAQLYNRLPTLHSYSFKFYLLELKINLKFTETVP